MNPCKIALIYNQDDEKRNIKKGSIVKLGDITDEESFHSQCLLDYAKEKYSDIEIFKQLNNRHRPETIGYFFTLLDIILFFDTTSNIEKYGKTGFFMLPNEIDHEVKDILYDFGNSIDDYSVGISYDLKVEDGIVVGKELYPNSNEHPHTLFDKYFAKKAKEENKIRSV